jgi:very-short-patch-repair endonuclease
MFKDIAPRPKTGGVKRARKLRKKMTLPEVLLWQRPRLRPHGLKFRAQHPTGDYTLDFHCSDARLAIEIDGRAHDHPDQVEHDRRRDAWAASHGIDTLRVPASELLADVDRAVEAIVEYCRALAPPPPGCAGRFPSPRQARGGLKGRLRASAPGAILSKCPRKDRAASAGLKR